MTIVLDVLSVILLACLVMLLTICCVLAVWIGIEELRSRIDERHEREQFRAMLRGEKVGD